MILIGRLLSPFVRRVQVSLNLLGLECERKPYGTATHVEEIAAHNPLKRVPALILEDGETLIDSAAILDYLDELVGPDRALIPASRAERRATLKLLALATDAAEKGVIAFYELNRRPDDKIWKEAADKYSEQILGGLGAIEEAAPADGGWLVGGKISQADITTACVYEFIQVVLPGLLNDTSLPRITRLVARLNELEGYFSTHPSTE